ncbi:MAG: helix-turn-helix domain-containing protein [Ruminococcus sp.]|nr:helix-turn-helix domain-containing protein [Ruminococcus sp.]
MNTENSQQYLIQLGERLRGVRLLKGITQKQAAKDTGMSQSFLSSVERGKKSACTAQVIALIRYYKVPYDMIFGSENGDFTLNDFPQGESPDICVELLNQLVGKARCADLIKGTGNCIKIVVYVVFRTVYRENPRNSVKLFSMSYEETLQMAKKILTAAPANIARFIRETKSINAGCFELPPERNAELRTFIHECEMMLKNVDYSSLGEDGLGFEDIITQK